MSNLLYITLYMSSHYTCHHIIHAYPVQWEFSSRLRSLCWIDTFYFNGLLWLTFKFISLQILCIVVLYFKSHLNMHLKSIQNLYEIQVCPTDSFYFFILEWSIFTCICKMWSNDLINKIIVYLWWFSSLCGFLTWGLPDKNDRQDKKVNLFTFCIRCKDKS
jgi:hypothetical protein